MRTTDSRHNQPVAPNILERNFSPGQPNSSSLKQELVYTTAFATHEQARLALFEYIEVFYNRQRRHSSLGYVSPVDFELAAQPEKLAA